MIDYERSRDLYRLRDWPYLDPKGWLEFAESLWSDYGKTERAEDGTVTFCTGGWSGNETILRYMALNRTLWAITWQSSHRGGRHVFKPGKR